MQAPVGGTFEQRSVLGSPTGVRITVARGELLPNAPRGFTWSITDCVTDDGAAH
jgi:hypothetical protein